MEATGNLLKPISSAWLKAEQNGVFFVYDSQTDLLQVQSPKHSVAFEDGQRAVLKLFLTKEDTEKYIKFYSKKIGFENKNLAVGKASLRNTLDIVNDRIGPNVTEILDKKGLRVDLCTFLNLPNGVKGLMTIDVLCGHDDVDGNLKN